MCDIIHETKRRSIYERTDYLVNSDMSIPVALAQSWQFGVAAELDRHVGLPQVDRRPFNTPLVLRRPKLPEGK